MASQVVGARTIGDYPKSLAEFQRRFSQRIFAMALSHDLLLARNWKGAAMADLVRALNKTPRANRIYVRLLADLPGAVVNGEAMGSLPPSVQSVFTDNRAGNSSILRQAVLGAWDRRLDVTVRGSRELSFSVDTGR